MAGSDAAPRRLLAAYVVAGVVTMATWTQFDAISWRALLPLVVVFAIERWPHQAHRALRDGTWLREVRRRPWPGRPSVASIAIGLVVCLPLLVHLLATLHEEFPYGGDEGYHFSATRTFANHLVRAVPWLAGLFLILAVVRVVHRRYLLTLAIAGLWALSVRFGPEMTFARYPAAFYFLAAPVNVLGELIGFSNPHVNNHVVNTLSVVAWLFVLRPIVVRRWPDVPALIGGLLLFYQPTVVTYFGGGGLEPWSLVLLLVALEAASRLPIEDRWVAVLVAGCAAWIKEPAILFLPLVFVLAMVDWRGRLPSLRPGAVALGAIAATPFITYYFVRHTLELPRFYALVGFDELFARARALEWIERMHLQFGDTGLVLLVLLAVFAVAGVVIHRSEDARRAHIMMVGFAAALIAFFYVDVQGVPYTGYGRYLMFPYVGLVAAAMLGATQLLASRRMAALFAVVAVVAACQAYPLASILALDFRPDYTRNSLEWHRCLIRLPIRQLAHAIGGSDAQPTVTAIRLVTITLDTQITSVAYPDLVARYTVRPSIQLPEEVDCRCQRADEAVIAGFEYRANFDGRTPNDPRVELAEQACVRQLQSTCTHVDLEQSTTGHIVGALGVGPSRGQQEP